MDQGKKKTPGFKDAKRPDRVVETGTDAALDEKLKRLEAEVLASKTTPSLKPAAPLQQSELKSESRPGHNMTMFWTIVVLSVVLSKLPFADFLFAPLNQFATMIHEMGHAIACLLTGGHVEGMTIVSDGAGHGGLTFMRGGFPFIQVQAGYLGTALFGCFLVYIGQFRRLSKFVLVAMGLTMATATVLFIGRALFSESFMQALFS
ncbi:MAG: M50 family metallopeptidase, partial [Cyanobacteria bacterium]|nr:M50 family metallopeptidase [Cyanobacteriota bacterium]